MIRPAITVLLLLLSTSWSFGQERPDPENPVGGNLEVPEYWNVRLDRPDDSAVIGSESENADIYFVNMVPGWHITTGPAAIFWSPASTATGSYRAEAVFDLFDPQGLNEAFGLFIGGQNLENEDQAYSYFLLRNSGQYLVKNRTGGSTGNVQNWTSAPSMNRFTGETESSVRNTLAVEVTPEEVTFWVNGDRVAAFPAGELYTEGVVGLRVNHRLNVHVSDLNVEQR